MMAEQSFLSSEQMGSVFALLHACDLIWAAAIRDYLLGKCGTAFALMAWNIDATRTPTIMYSEYLRQRFLNNDLVDGRCMVGGKAVSMGDIRAPIFAIGTEHDHVAPRQSVYKLHLLSYTDTTFLLTSGGHNAGIVSEPNHPHRHYRIADSKADATYQSPSQWLVENAVYEGSWLAALSSWLNERSGKLAPTPKMGKQSGDYKALCDAPGTYVMQR